VKDERTKLDEAVEEARAYAREMGYDIEINPHPLMDELEGKTALFFGPIVETTGESGGIERRASRVDQTGRPSGCGAT
jgi:hypothetical protein